MFCKFSSLSHLSLSVIHSTDSILFELVGQILLFVFKAILNRESSLSLRLFFCQIGINVEDMSLC